MAEGGIMSADSHFGDVCNSPSCSLCVLWPQSGEGRASWLARVRAQWDATPEPRCGRTLDATCRMGHARTVENTGVKPSGNRVCKPCAHAAYKKRRQAA